MIIITTYNRPDMLLRLLKELQGYDYIVVLDDGSEYDVTPFLPYCEYHRLPHLGKEGFWMTWDYALQRCKDSNSEWFMFMPDDVHDVQIGRIDKLRKSLRGAYCYNLMRFDYETGWTRKKPIYIPEMNAFDSSFVDCGYFCPRESLEALDWKMEWISPERFNRPLASSGVGYQQTKRYGALKIPMYTPEVSFCKHGDHESEMHPVERKRNPLISK